MSESIILYVHHVGSHGGATNSLNEMVGGTTSQLKRVLMAPHGSASRHFEEFFDEVIYVRGVPQFDNTRFSFYRGVRWLILLRELYLFLLSFPILLSYLLKNSKKIVAVHYNEVTLIPLALCSQLFRLQHVFHVRSVQQVNKRQAVIFRLFSNAIFLPIDEYVDATLPRDAKRNICRNTFKLDEKKKFYNEQLHENLATFEFVILGGEPYQKGIDIALEALTHLRQSRKLDLRVTIFGLPNLLSLKTKIRRKLSRSYDACIGTLLMHQNSDWVTIESFNYERDEIFKNKNALLFTSRLNAPGRPIIEASYFGIPSIFCTDRQIDGVFEEVSISCANGVENVVSAIETLLENYTEKYCNAPFEKVTKIHSSTSQACVLTRTYGEKICEKY
mgnify:CR=1 FL=1